jgi:GT2 family glycosyltransferase
VDGNSPPRVAKYLNGAASEHDFRLIRTDRFVSPNEARSLGLAEVRTQCVVFMDNDCEVAPGWLDSLVRCATETGAHAVAPLYLEGDPSNRTIHMACGTARISETNGLRMFKSNHALAHRHYDEVRDELRRTETEMFEFHCVLLRVDALRAVGGLDTDLLSAHEHEDLSLLIRQAGGTIYLEPAAQITYLFGYLDRYDVQYARLRWSNEWNLRSTRHFREKWRLGATWGAESVEWCNDHRRMLLRETRGPINVLRRRLQRVVEKIRGGQSHGQGHPG